jgi:hypothetical protein
MLLILANIGGGAGSAWGLKTVLDEKMKEAFEFDPEEEEQKAKEKKDGDEDEDEEDEDDEEDDE